VGETVAVVSTPGCGTTVRALLPAGASRAHRPGGLDGAAAPPEAAGSGSGGDDGAGGHVIKVLIVDEHEVVRQRLRFVLTQEPGFEVVGRPSTGWRRWPRSAG
jgi:hypothetical protein